MKLIPAKAQAAMAPPTKTFRCIDNLVDMEKPPRQDNRLIALRLVQN